MKKVLVFFNAQPVRVVNVSFPDRDIHCEYPNGEKLTLGINTAGIHSITGDHREICVASDRQLVIDEIIMAANRLL